MADQPGNRRRRRASVDEVALPGAAGGGSPPTVAPSDFSALLIIAAGFVVVMVILAQSSFRQVTALNPARVEGVAGGDRAADAPTLTARSGQEEVAGPAIRPGSEPGGGAEAVGVVVEATQASVAMVGVVPNQAIVEELVARAEEIYPSDQVDNRLLVDETTAIPVVVTVRGKLTDPVLYQQVAAAFSGIVGVEILFTDDFVLAESSDLEQALNRLAPIRFRSGWSFISPESLPTLDQLAVLLNDHPDVVIEIGGHTDSNGSKQVNQLLSQFRAEAVRDQLAARGVINKMQTRGFGETRLRVVPDDSDEARETNRRIEFRVLD